MKKLFLIMSMILVSVAGTAQAAMDYGLELGIRQQAGDVSGPNNSANSMTGMQFGGYFHYPLQGGVAHFRIGLLYTQRPLESENDVTRAKKIHKLRH